MNCPECKSEEVMVGEPSLNSDEKLTSTAVCLDCGYTWEIPEMTAEQNAQVDLIHSVAYDAICRITGEELPWDMEWIGVVCDSLCEHAMRITGKTEMEIYPYTEE